MKKTSFINPYDKPIVRSTKEEWDRPPDPPLLRIVASFRPSDKTFWFQKFAVNKDDEIGCA